MSDDKPTEDRFLPSLWLWMLAFFISPPIAGICIGLFLGVPHSFADAKFFLLSVPAFAAISGYPPELVLGLPLFFLCVLLGWVRLIHFLAAGFVAGLLSPFIIMLAYPNANFSGSQHTIFGEFEVICLTASMISSVLTWLIIRPWRGRSSL
ncbi:MAG: hypothetical protein P4L54_01035 [Acidocella sp.]|nr:hypothetical protein [Acidocella sp.]